MAGTVEHPDIRYVVHPVHLDGTPTGAMPRLRHDPDCSHFEWEDGTVLGTPQLAAREDLTTAADDFEWLTAQLRDHREPAIQRLGRLTALLDILAWTIGCT
jgi:hypothetical protein